MEQTSREHEEIDFAFNPGSLIRSNSNFLEECSELYSSHYGVWAADAPHAAGKRVRLSAARLREWLSSDDSEIAYAQLNG